MIHREVQYDSDHKFTVTMEAGDCKKCLCKQCANGCGGLVCKPLCKNEMKVINCTDFDDDDDWY